MASQRSRMVDASGIRKVFDLARSLERPVNLSIGQPDFDVPGVVKDAAKRAIDDGLNTYTVTQGIPELHERLRAEARKAGYEPEDILVTSGVSGGLVLAMLALCDPGDEILVPDPYFVMYKHLANLFGIVPRYIDTYPDFRLREEAVRPLLSERTKLVVANTPANPTGVSLTETETRFLADLARERDLIVLSDEIYRCFEYEPAAPSIATLHERTIVFNGFSKSHGMTGWRLGYAMGPRDLIQEMTKLQQYTFVCAPSMVQYAGLAALDLPMDETLAAYRRKRDIIYEGLKDRFEVARPDGAFYIFPKAPGGMTGTDFCVKAVENNALIIPGSVFSERDTHFRISFAADDAVLEEGVEILNRLAGEA